MLSFHARENGEPAFPDSSVGNIVCCAVIIVIALPAWKQFLLSITLPEDQWFPTPLGSQGILFMAGLFIWFAVITSLAHVRRFLSIPIEERYRSIYITEATLAVLFVLSLVQVFHMDTEVRYLFQARDKAAFQKLEVGMSKRNVEALIVETNLALIGPPRNGWLNRTSASHYGVYLRLRDALETARSGRDIDFSDFDERGFRSTSIFRLVSRDDGSDTFERIYKLGAFSDDDYSYRLLVKYDDSNRLQWAQYERADGGVMPCTVLQVGEAPIPQVPWVCPSLDGY
jgi:hypothetical protein